MSKTLSPSAVELVSAKESLAFFRSRVAELRATVKQELSAAKVEKTIARQARQNTAAAKKAERIAKLEAKLLAMKTGKVGAKAIKANKKPSACTTVYQMAA